MLDYSGHTLCKRVLPEGLVRNSGYFASATSTIASDRCNWLK